MSPPRGFELGAFDTRPRDGFMPTTPQQLEGILIDPPPSEPSAIGQRQAATAAADPPLEPPAVLPRSQGFRVGGKRPYAVVARLPNSGVFVFPRSTPPASRRRRATAASRVGTLCSRSFDPYVVRRPAVSVRSLRANGMPASGRAAPSFRRRSTPSAIAITISSSMVTKEPIRSST